MKGYPIPELYRRGSRMKTEAESVRIAAEDISKVVRKLDFIEDKFSTDWDVYRSEMLFWSNIVDKFADDLYLSMKRMEDADR